MCKCVRVCVCNFLVLRNPSESKARRRQKKGDNRALKSVVCVCVRVCHSVSFLLIDFILSLSKYYDDFLKPYVNLGLTWGQVCVRE